jgi:hypothetical protein
MTRAGNGSQAPPGAVSAPANTCIRAAAGVSVAGLAGAAVHAIAAANRPGVADGHVPERTVRAGEAREPCRDLPHMNIPTCAFRGS